MQLSGVEIVCSVDGVRNHLDLVLVPGSDVGDGPASLLFYALLVVGRQQGQEVAERPVLDDDLHTQNPRLQQ